MDTTATKSSSTALVVTKKKKKSSRKKHSSSSECSSFHSETSSQVTDSSQDFNESTATNDTGRTSLGKTIRAGYTSYSEKFLAEQECEKKRYLLAIMEGRPLDDFGYNAKGEGKQLLLMDGSTGSVDPDADRSLLSSRMSSHGDSTTGSTATSSHASSYNASTFNTSAHESEESKKSSVVQPQTRRGVYGGGVQYFTPQQSYREEDDEEESVEASEDCSTDNEDFEEETQDSYSHDDTTEQESRDSNTLEIEGGSSMGSMFSEEESTYMQSSAGVDSVDVGVESVTTMSTAEQNEVLEYESNRKSRRARSPPGMATISDDSSSYNSR